MIIEFLRRSGSIFSTNIFSMFVLFITGVIITRRLGPELLGSWALVLLAVNIIGMGHFGLSPAITYFTGKGEHDKGKILTFIICSSFFIGIALSTIFYFTYQHIRGIWTGLHHHIIIIGLISVPFTFFINFFSSFLMGKFKVRQKNFVNIIRVASYLVLITSLIWILKGKVLETTIAYTSSMIIAAVLGLALFSNGIKPTRITKFSFINPFFKYGLKSYAIIIFTFLNYRLDMFLVKHFLETSDVGFYYRAVSIAEQLWYIPNALNHVLVPTLLLMDKGSSEFTAKVCRNSLLITTILAVIIVLTCRFFIVLIYGIEFLPVVSALYSIMWGIIITTAYKVLMADFAARRRLGVTILAAFIGVVVNVLLNLYMIPRLGIVGAGVSTSISYTILAVILIAFFMRQQKVALKDILIPNSEDVEDYRKGINKLLKRLKGERNSDKSTSAPPDDFTE